MTSSYQLNHKKDKKNALAFSSNFSFLATSAKIDSLDIDHDVGMNVENSMDRKVFSESSFIDTHQSPCQHKKYASLNVLPAKCSFAIEDLETKNRSSSVITRSKWVLKYIFSSTALLQIPGNGWAMMSPPGASFQWLTWSLGIFVHHNSIQKNITGTFAFHLYIPSLTFAGLRGFMYQSSFKEIWLPGCSSQMSLH